MASKQVLLGSSIGLELEALSNSLWPKQMHEKKKKIWNCLTLMVKVDKKLKREWTFIVLASTAEVVKINAAIKSYTPKWTLAIANMELYIQIPLQDHLNQLNSIQMILFIGICLFSTTITDTVEKTALSQSKQMGENDVLWHRDNSAVSFKC